MVVKFEIKMRSVPTHFPLNLDTELKSKAVLAYNKCNLYHIIIFNLLSMIILGWLLQPTIAYCHIHESTGGKFFLSYLDIRHRWFSNLSWALLQSFMAEELHSFSAGAIARGHKVGSRLASSINSAHIHTCPPITKSLYESEPVRNVRK